MKTEQEIIQDILSHKYYVHGKCVNCGTEFERCTNSRGLKSSCCSDECFKEIKSKKIKRSKERHHYEVFKDDKYYYIKEDGRFNERRNFKGTTWRSKEYVEELRQSGDWFYEDFKPAIMGVNTTIPENAIKIIDKVSAYLYDNEHPFDKWKNLWGLNLASNEGI